MTPYTAGTPILGQGTVSAEAIDAWLQSRAAAGAACSRSAKAIRGDVQSSSLRTHHAQSVPLVAAFSSSAFHAALEVSRPTIYAFVQPHVLRVTHDLKVLRAVVSAVAVDVVDVISGRERPTCQHLSNESVLGNATNTRGVIDYHVAVADAGCALVVVRFLAGRHCLVATRTRTVLRQVRPIATRLIRRSAVMTSTFNRARGASIGAHWSLLTTDVMPRGVTAPPGLSHASILPFATQKEAYG